MLVSRSGLVFLLLLLAGCGDSPGRDATVQLDTLYGFKLGTLYPDALEEAKQRDIPLSCEDDRTSAMVYCQHPLASPLDPGTYTLSFEEGRLVFIRIELRDTWRGVPVDTLLGRLAPFGRPSDVTDEDGYYGQTWTRGDIERGVSCHQPKSAADCELWVQIIEEEV
jgi:hypothetical protein